MFCSKLSFPRSIRNACLMSRSFSCSTQCFKWRRPDFEINGKADPELLEKTLPKLPHRERGYFMDEISIERPKGLVYDCQPFKVKLEEGKMYAWCSCGRSKSQPFCDGTHKLREGAQHTAPKMVKYRPVRFKVEETKEYWMCNCKQTSNAPHCDLTHRREDIQERFAPPAPVAAK